MALGLSAHTLRLQLRVYGVSACWRLELDYDVPSRYAALAGTPVIMHHSACLCYIAGLKTVSATLVGCLSEMHTCVMQLQVLNLYC